MPTRMWMIGKIRDMLDRLLEQGRIELFREILGDYDRFNFTGVSTKEISRLYEELFAVCRCRFCRGDERATSCECV